MKQILTSLALLATTSCAFAQATLLKTVTGFAGVALFSASGEKIYTSDSNHVYLYNMDGTIWKTITFPVLAGYRGGYGGALSDHLFNSDDLIELVVTYSPHLFTSIRPNYQNVLINETGTVLQNLDTNANAYVHYDQDNNTYQLFTYNYETYTGTNIYTLPGTMPCGQCGSLGSERLAAGSQRLYVGNSYPNPASGFTQISYNMPAGTSGTLIFYNSVGEKVLEQAVASTGSSVHVSLSGMLPGVYNYYITSDNNISNTQSMVIK